MWEVIQGLVAGGTSLLLTTQNLEEADLLASNIVVIDHGKVIAEGTADELKAQVGGERLEITVADGSQLAAARELLEPLGVGKASMEPHRRSLLMPVSGGAAVLTDALRRLDASQIALDDVGLRRPTLDDVFLSLTGHATGEADGQGNDSHRHGSHRHGSHRNDSQQTDAQQTDAQVQKASR
jgi:ABC-2 type transport system ATP-binding protein